jgi:hypothetical protein
MNIRTMMVATEASYAPVSLPCEPWMKANPIKLAPPPKQVFNRYDDGEEKLLAAIRAGHKIFDDIVFAAFGTRNGKVDMYGRKALRRLLDNNVISRERSNLPGKPFIWSMINAN